MSTMQGVHQVRPPPQATARLSLKAVSLGIWKAYFIIYHLSETIVYCMMSPKPPFLKECAFIREGVISGG